jgi:hypothetical protein
MDEALAMAEQREMGLRKCAAGVRKSRPSGRRGLQRTALRSSGAHVRNGRKTLGDGLNASVIL